MLEELTAAQLAELEAYAAIEPFGPHQDDWRSIGAAHLVFNAFRGKNDRQLKLFELFPHLEEHVDDEDAADRLLEGLPSPEELECKLADLFASRVVGGVRAPAP